jgi:hypothetical protein
VIRPDTLLGDVLGRLVYLRKLRRLALKLYERVPDDKVRVRTSQVGQDVAALLDVNYSAYFQRDLNDALKRVGWRTVNVSNNPQWKGVRRR